MRMKAYTCVMEVPYKTFPIPAECYNPDVCTDAWVNSFITGCLQCSVNFFYPPSKKGYGSYMYNHNLQSLVDLSDGCADRNTPFVSTTALTEPLLPAPTPANYLGRPRECATVCSHVEKQAEYNLFGRLPIQRCLDTGPDPNAPECSTLQYFCGNGSANYEQLAKCYQCRLISAANLEPSNDDVSSSSTYSSRYASKATDARTALDAISTGCAAFKVRVNSVPLYTEFPLPTDPARAVSASSWRTFTFNSAATASPTTGSGEASAPSQTKPSGAQPTAMAAAPAVVAAVAAVGVYIMS